MLHAGGHEAEAARELALAQRLSASFDGLDLKAAPAAAPQGLERLKEEFEPPRAQRIDAAFEMVGQRQQRELASFYLERGRRLAEQEHDREAESELTRALLPVALRRGGAPAARPELPAHRPPARGDRRVQGLDLERGHGGRAALALAEAYLEAHDPEAARAEVQRALAIDPTSVPAQKLLERLR